MRVRQFKTIFEKQILRHYRLGTIVSEYLAKTHCQEQNAENIRLSHYQFI